MKTIKLDECWLWAGSVSETDYGVIYYYDRGKTRNSRAHRVVYENYKGFIPKGLVIDHLCRVHRCINPEHLEAVTVEENVMRGVGATAKNARKTHCPEGHEFTPDNIITRYHGSNGRPNRHCKTCHRNYQREYMRKRYVKVADRV